MGFLKRNGTSKDQRPEGSIDTIEVIAPAEPAQGDLLDPNTVRLVKYDAAKRALAEAHSVDEVKDIMDKAKAVKIYARLKDDTELIDHATAIQKRAEIRIGELLIEMNERDERHSGHGDQKTGSQSATPKLSDMGLTKSESSRWQAEARLSPEEQEAMIEGAKRKARAKRKTSKASQEDAIEGCEAEVTSAVKKALKHIEAERRQRLRERLQRLINDLIARDRKKVRAARQQRIMARTKAKAKEQSAKPIIPVPEPVAASALDGQ
jgi:hypothetical protein